MSNANVEVVKSCYAAFLTGDLDGMVGRLTDDVDWEINGRKSDFPDFGAWHGAKSVREFFGKVGETLDFHTFEPREFHPSGDLVFVLGDYETTVKKTGRRVACQWLHAFWVKGGKVARFREFTDTARFAEAYRG